MSPTTSDRWQFWIDRGGTFTDVVGKRPDGTLATLKLLSDNPEQYRDAAVAGIRRLLGLAATAPITAAEVESVKMGTTVATNALLERQGEPAAAVLGTFGVERRVAVFSGRAAHAGATPMDLRQDSFLAAAQAALAIREVGVRHEGGVCTVGGATSEPGVVTAVAGRTEMLLDQRHLDAGELAAMLAEADEACERAAADHGCEVELRHLWAIPPIPFDERLIAFAKQAVQDAGGKDTAIPSGPLHDAAEMARLIPTVMLFSSSSPPVSHTPEEDTPEADLRVAIEAYGRTVAATLDLAAAGEL